MRQGLVATAILLVFALTTGGCTASSNAEAEAAKPVTSSVERDSLRFVLQIPSRVRAGQPVAAGVTFENVSKETTLAFDQPAGAARNVRVVDGAGRVVYDSFQANGGSVPRPPVTVSIAPGASSTRSLEFVLRQPGEYQVVAFTMADPLETPPAVLTVTE